MPVRPARAAPRSAGSGPLLRRPAHGFTLVELVMVMVLVGVLAVVATPAMTDLTAWRVRAYADTLMAEFPAMQRRALSQRRAITATLNTSGVSFTDSGGTTLASWPCPATLPGCIAESGPRTVTFNAANSGSVTTSSGTALPLSVGSGSAQRRLQIESETGLIRVLP